jgi:hypothetical protein
MASARKPLSFANKLVQLTPEPLIVAKEEGTANSVPAAAVIQRSRALFGFTGRKGCVGGEVSRM